MSLFSVSISQFAVLSLGCLMIGTAIVLCLALLYLLIKVIEDQYPDKSASTIDTIARCEDIIKPVVTEKIRPQKKNIEPSVPDDIPSFGGPPKIETNFDPGGLGKEIKE